NQTWRREAVLPRTVSRRTSCYLVGKTMQIETIYPLSPMQQGMLFHTIHSPRSGVYSTQITLEIRSNLVVPAFGRAWQHIIDRHAALRTSFVWKRLKTPLQVVHRSAKVSFCIIDWRHLSGSEKERNLEEILQNDLRIDFDLSKTPLSRMLLIQCADNFYYFVWSFHHILMDGWSLPIVLQEAFSSYEAFARGKEASLPLPTSYSKYVAWLQQQDLSKAERYWRQTLEGIAAPTPLPMRRETSNQIAP